MLDLSWQNNRVFETMIGAPYSDELHGGMNLRASLFSARHRSSIDALLPPAVTREEEHRLTKFQGRHGVIARRGEGYGETHVRMPITTLFSMTNGRFFANLQRPRDYQHNRSVLRNNVYRSTILTPGPLYYSSFLPFRFISITNMRFLLFMMWRITHTTGFL